MLASIVFRFSPSDDGARELLDLTMVSAMALGLLVEDGTGSSLGDSRASSRAGAGAGFSFCFWFASSARARHSSVRLRQTLSAFLRSCRSVTPPSVAMPIALARLEMGPGWPMGGIIADRATASLTADSRALYTSELILSLVLLRAVRSRGWAESRGVEESWVELPPRLGDAETVVALVVAVRGLSSDGPAVDSFPLCSRRAILDLRSSTSSQTDAAAVEEEDSVPSI